MKVTTALDFAAPLPKFKQIKDSEEEQEGDARLGLDGACMSIYKQHWTSVAGDLVDGLLPAKPAAAFFSLSNVSKERLKVIWELSDTVPPQWKLNETEFYTALKYIALEQGGTPVDHTTRINVDAPLPQVDVAGKDALAAPAQMESTHSHAAAQVATWAHRVKWMSTNVPHTRA